MSTDGTLTPDPSPAERERGGLAQAGRGEGSLLDTMQRPLRDLRISVPARCNFRCTYCMPREVFGRDYEFLDRDEILTFEEITRLARIFAGLGVEKIRLTGGEPTPRRALPPRVGA